MKVKVDIFYKHKSLTLAEIGNVTVGDDCIIEVPDSVGEGLVANLGWEEVKETEQTDSDKTEEDTAEAPEAEDSAKEDEIKTEDDSKEEDSDETKDETEEKSEEQSDAKASLLTLKKEELVDLATKAELPVEEWKSLSKTALVKYLTEKI